MTAGHWYRRLVLGGASALLIGAVCEPVLADGSEALGTPTIGIAEGSDFVIGGVGVLNDSVSSFARPGSRDRLRGGLSAGGFATSHRPGIAQQLGAPALLVDVPLGVSIEQVLLYWEGQSQSEAEVGPTDSITLNPGGAVTGDRIGGPTFFFDDSPIDYWTATYRKDITSLGLITNGANAIEVSGLDFTSTNEGVGIVVIVDDGSGASVQIADGNDAAWGFCPFGCGSDDASLTTTEPVVYEFDPAGVARLAKLGGFWGNEGPNGAGGRPTIIRVTTGGNVTDFNDVLANNVGDDWDAHVLHVTVPAGATSLSVQSLSEDSGTGPYAGNLVASFVWTTSAFSFGAPLPDAGACCLNGGCTIITRAQCDAAGGDFRGPGTTCGSASCGDPSDSGACCLETVCTILRRSECDALGGDFRGPGTTCGSDECGGTPETGACCIDGACTEVTRNECDAAGGDFAGPGSECDVDECGGTPETGACCLDGECSIVTRDECDALEGDFRGPGTTCGSDECGGTPETGACCIDGSCTEVTRDDCDAAGGDFAGPGTACEPDSCGDDCPPPSVECRATTVEGDDHGDDDHGDDDDSSDDHGGGFGLTGGGGSGDDDDDHSGGSGDDDDDHSGGSGGDDDDHSGGSGEDDDDHSGGSGEDDDDHSGGGDGDGTLLLIEFSGSSDCADPVRVDGVIDIGCELVSVESGQLVKVICSTGDDDHSGGGYGLTGGWGWGWGDDDDDHSGGDDHGDDDDDHGDDDDDHGDDDDECVASLEDGVLVIRSATAVLIVTATDATGQQAICTTDLCEDGGDDDHGDDDHGDDDHGDDDDDHSGGGGDDHGDDDDDHSGGGGDDRSDDDHRR